MKINMYKDILLLVALFILPSLVFIHPIIGKFDEIIFIYMLISVMYRAINKSKNLFFSYLLILYISYSLFLIIYNSIPLSHVMQIFITSKFIIIFLYFYTLPDKYKGKVFIKLIDFIIVIFLLSILFTILQFLLPAYFCGYAPDGRGFMGINAGGIFCGRIAYSEFLLTFLIVLMSLKKRSSRLITFVIQFRYWLLLLTLILLFLTFSRKEMILGFLLLLFLFKDKIDKNSKIVFYLFLCALLGLGLLGFYMLFQDINNSTFTDKQVRYLILLNALNIFNFYFPFGSGPGTFGSIMSMDYQVVYEQFNVPKHIYLGYGGDSRGPIFDLFLVSMLAEYGLGLLLIFAMLYKIGFKGFNRTVESIINVEKAKKALIVQVIAIAFFVPILLNWNGFLIFSLLGVMSNNRSVI